MKRVVITGASGMIGSTLADILVEEGVSVVAVVRPGSNKINNVPVHPLVEKVECDLSDLSGLKKLQGDECDTFFHFAWEGVYGALRDDVAVQEKNYSATLDAVRLAKELGCTKFVGSGSQAECGPCDSFLKSDTEAHPVMAYGAAKLKAYRDGLVLAEKCGIDFLWGRIISAYGPRDSKLTMVGSILRKMLKGETCDLSLGTQTWDFAYSADVANAFKHIAQSGVAGKPYPIGGGEPRLLRDYILSMKKVAKSNSVLNFGALPMGKTTFLAGDISELVRDTGFAPKVSFEEGISKTIESIGGCNE